MSFNKVYEMRLMISTGRFKQCLVLITTACFILILFFLGNGIEREGLDQRSLQQEGESPKDHRKDMLVIVRGQKSTYSKWVTKLGPIDASLTLLYGSYDNEIPEIQRENLYQLNVQSLFVPDTTWTQARNLLAAEALRMEVRRGKQYDYWIFFDDDVEVVCAADGGDKMEQLLGPGSCWQKTFNFIGSDLVPENASGVYIGGQHGFAAASNTDAMFAAFKRSHVPYLLPYATLPLGASEWSSQAALFCIMQTCMKSSMVLMPYIGGYNPAHRDYIRGLDLHEIIGVIVHNYHDKAAGFHPCAEGVNTDQGKDTVGPFGTKEELNNHIPPTEFEMCSPMKTRYEEWAQNVIAPRLAEKEGESPVPALAGKETRSTDHDVSSMDDTSVAHAKDTDILAIVMGEKSTYTKWVTKLGPIDASLTLLYGSYDNEIPEIQRENLYQLNVQSLFVPDTTWTQARNLLAAEALRMEVRRGKQYDYWIFFDDDVEVVCAADGGDKMEQLLGPGSCWQKTFNFIGSDLVPENASGVYIGGQHGFAAASNTDAMFAAFKRSHVPYLLPYATLPLGASEWSSQAALFCIMQTCMKSSMVLMPYIGGYNPAHRDYIRGLDLHEIIGVIVHNYHDKAAGFHPCAGGVNIDQGKDTVGPFGTKEELNNHIPPTEFEMCSPMKTRYEEWAQNVNARLAEKEGESPVPALAGKETRSNDHDVSSMADTSVAHAKDTDILVIVMGQKNSFPTWLERLGSINGSLSLLFGSFDENIPENACNNDNGLDCQVAFIPDTTWTEGRNLLAGGALRKEVRRGKKYDYWLFLDDDVEADCFGGEAMEKLLGEGSCWQKIFNFIGSDHVPENASIVTLPNGDGTPGFAGFSTTDAMFAAFKRDLVPYLLPYAALKEGSSEWTSQASLFCIMRTCLQSSAVLVPYVIGMNPLLQRNFIRGYNLGQIKETIADNYHDERAGFYPCAKLNGNDVVQGVDPTGTFDTSLELNDHIPPHDLELCDPMKTRFERWEREQIDPKLIALEPLKGFVSSLIKHTVVSEIVQDSAPKYSLPDEFKLGRVEEIDILVMVSGPFRALQSWKERLQVIYGSISLIFASTDEDIPENACHNGFDFDCHVTSIAGTTWTEGRNILAAEALRKEKTREKEYDYWVFLDYNVIVNCGGGEPMEELLGRGSCWQEIFSFIASDHVPENASSITLSQGDGTSGFAAVSTTDAMFAAFKRNRVPYLLPYPTLKKASKQWTSQASLFCIMRTCMQRSTVLVPYIGILHPEGHDFVEELDLDELRDTIVENYHDDEADFHPCSGPSQAHLNHRVDYIITFKTGEELNENIPASKLELCEPLLKRFKAWESQITVSE